MNTSKNKKPVIAVDLDDALGDENGAAWVFSDAMCAMHHSVDELYGAEVACWSYCLETVGGTRRLEMPKGTARVKDW